MSETRLETKFERNKREQGGKLGDRIKLNREHTAPANNSEPSIVAFDADSITLNEGSTFSIVNNKIEVAEDALVAISVVAYPFSMSASSLATLKVRNEDLDLWATVYRNLASGNYTSIEWSGAWFLEADDLLTVNLSQSSASAEDFGVEVYAVRIG